MLSIDFVSALLALSVFSPIGHRQKKEKKSKFNNSIFNRCHNATKDSQVNWSGGMIDQGPLSKIPKAISLKITRIVGFVKVLLAVVMGKIAKFLVR